MKNGILISTLVVCLTACGGDSDSDSPPLNTGNDSPTVYTDFSSDLKGVEEQPALANAVISEGDSASLNTIYTGNVLESSSVEFSFTLEENKQVALILSSGVTDLDLTVSGNGEYFYTGLDTSNEVVVFGAEVGINYRVEVESNEGAGEFQLKLVEANRSSVGMVNGEYLVRSDNVIKQKCTVNGIEKDEFTINDSSFEIVNWSAGYYAEAAGAERLPFSSVNGNTFTINHRFTISKESYSLSAQINRIFSANFITGEISSSSNSSSEYTRGEEERLCNSVSSATGNVIL